ncbi:RidA family protein [Parasutterella sp.]|uniref:RidA family protein n=1 Tax=Parasutterella sp. TaxID=2049037 RepID=UPI0035220830
MSKTGIYIADLNDWPEINRLYSERFKSARPARVVVPVKELHFGYRLEVELMAAV